MPIITPFFGWKEGDDTCAWLQWIGDDDNYKNDDTYENYPALWTSGFQMISGLQIIHLILF